MPTSRQPKIIPLARHHFSRHRWSFIADNNSVLANLLSTKPDTIVRFDCCASERPHAPVPRRKIFIWALSRHSVDDFVIIISLPFAFFLFFSFDKRRVREEPRNRFIRIYSNYRRRRISSPIRWGARNYFSGSIIPGYELYPSILLDKPASRLHSLYPFSSSFHLSSLPI